MDIISFSCPSCGHTLKIGADKAGRRARCPKCKTSLVIPSPNQPQGVPSGASDNIFGDEEEGAYQLLDEPEPSAPEIKYGEEEEEEKEEEEEEEEEEEQKPKRRRRDFKGLRKAPIHPEKWEKIRLGMIFIAVGLGFWMASFALQKLVLLVGFLSPMEYGHLASTELVDPTATPEAGYAPTLYRAHFAIGLLGGSFLLPVWMWVYRLAFLFVMLQLVGCGVGYGLCINAPSGYGIRGLAIGTLAVAVVNLFLTLLFRFLPVVGVTFLTMITVFAPEVALISANIGRLEPIQVTLSPAPFWEGLFAIIIRLLVYLEPVLFTIMLRACAKALQDEVMEKKTDALIRLGLGLAFMDTTFVLLADAGTSEVLVMLLRATYLLFTGFYIWYLIWLMVMAFETRYRIRRNIRLGAL